MKSIEKKVLTVGYHRGASRNHQGLQGILERLALKEQEWKLGGFVFIRKS